MPLFFTLIGIITFVAFLHAMARKKYVLSRTIVINRPRAEIFAYCRQLRNRKYWMPWLGMGKRYFLKYHGEDGKEGAAMYWKKAKRKEEGMERITKLKEGKLLESHLLFMLLIRVRVLQYIAVKQIDEERTKIVLGIRGVHKFPVSVIALFYDVEKIFGKDFEVSLEHLKNILEKR